ncbi:hypothetical protein DH2020_028424 [Rehmannia glutinosa]|uniref:CBS domain-containing protein n=1 Tax=Rehmannia glutinosa TaxID=99300 RepID=A0ABR0VU63_REHGL
MASVFLYHVVGDLTVGKPELSEFSETETLAAAIRTIGDTSEGGIPVWRKRSQMCAVESAESRQQRFVGILNALDIVAFLAREDCLADQDKAINTPVSECSTHDLVLMLFLLVVDFIMGWSLIVYSGELVSLHVSQLDGATCALDFDLCSCTSLIDALEMMKHGVKRFLVPKSSIWRGMSKRFSILYNGRWLKNADPPSGGSSTNTLVNTNRPPSSSTSSIQDKFCCLSREDALRFLIGCLGALAPLPLSSIASSELSIQTTVALKHPSRHRCHQRTSPRSLCGGRSGQFVMGVEDNMNSRSLPNDINSLDEILANGEDAVAPCKPCGVTEAENDDNLVGVVGYADILSAVTRQPPAAAVSENS